MKNYVVIIIILMIFSGCKNEPLNLKENYVVYVKTFGEDPIIITDPLYKPSNKKRMFQYPKNTIIYEKYRQDYRIKDFEYIQIRLKFYYKIIDPIKFYSNRKSIDDIGRALSWNVRECTENYFMNKSKSEINKLLYDNELNKEYFNIAKKEALKGSTIDDPIKGIQLENIEIVIEQEDLELEEDKDLMDKIKNIAEESS